MVAVHRERLVEVLDGPRDVRLGQLTHRRSTAQVGLEGGRRGVVGARQPRRLLARARGRRAQRAIWLATSRGSSAARSTGCWNARSNTGHANPGAQHGDPHASHPVEFHVAVPRTSPSTWCRVSTASAVEAASIGDTGVNDTTRTPGSRRSRSMTTSAMPSARARSPDETTSNGSTTSEPHRRHRGRCRRRVPPLAERSTPQCPRRARRQSAAAARTSSATRAPPDGRPIRSTRACSSPAAPRRYRRRWPPATPAP